MANTDQWRRLGLTDIKPGENQFVLDSMRRKMAPRILIFTVSHCLRELNIRRVGKAKCIFFQFRRRSDKSTHLRIWLNRKLFKGIKLVWFNSITGAHGRQGGMRWVNLRVTPKDGVFAHFNTLPLFFQRKGKKTSNFLLLYTPTQLMNTVSLWWERRRGRNKGEAIKKEKRRGRVKPKIMAPFDAYAASEAKKWAEREIMCNICKNHKCVCTVWFLWWRQVNWEESWQTYESSKTIMMQGEICSEPGDIAYLLQQLPLLERKSISIKTHPAEDAPHPSHPSLLLESTTGGDSGWQLELKLLTRTAGMHSFDPEVRSRLSPRRSQMWWKPRRSKHDRTNWVWPQTHLC